MESPTETAYLQGAIYGLAAVCIWGAFIVVKLRRYHGSVGRALSSLRAVPKLPR